MDLSDRLRAIATEICAVLGDESFPLGQCEALDRKAAFLLLARAKENRK